MFCSRESIVAIRIVVRERTVESSSVDHWTQRLGTGSPCDNRPLVETVLSSVYLLQCHFTLLVHATAVTKCSSGTVRLSSRLQLGRLTDESLHRSQCLQAITAETRPTSCLEIVTTRSSDPKVKEGFKICSKFSVEHNFKNFVPHVSGFIWKKRGFRY